MVIGLHIAGSLFGIAGPGPPVEVTGMIDPQPVTFHQKSHAHICGAQGGDGEIRGNLTGLMGPQIEGLFKIGFRHTGSGVLFACHPDVVGQNVVHLRMLPGQVKNLGHKMIPMGMTGKDIEWLVGAKGGKFPFIIIEEQGGGGQFHRKSAVGNIGDFHKQLAFYNVL